MQQMMQMLFMRFAYTCFGGDGKAKPLPDAATARLTMAGGSVPLR